MWLFMVWSFPCSNLYQIKFSLSGHFLQYHLYGFNDQKWMLWLLKWNQLRWTEERMEGRKGRGGRGRGRKKTQARKPRAVLISFLPLKSHRCPWNPMKSVDGTDSSIWASIGNGSGNLPDLWSDLPGFWQSTSGSLTTWPMLPTFFLLQNPANKDI